MLNIVKRQQQELLVGLANLYIQKESLDKQIEAQKVAIQQCATLVKEVEKGDDNVQP